ncbi:helix-turn-helix domain-containing protein [Carnobacterium sp. 1290_CSPC]|uniref:helix-turn-helix domain-containing protein n=1 Tax=Carnobacterium sp. 1290_CSPC TaxID=1579347 RepID=UPI00065FE943|nr:XRE family transcriptional regulator [Carnobacterium sp. 1290_CSPC]
MDLSKYTGQKIKSLREERFMTQDDLAEKMGTTRQTISRYESGSRKTNQDVLFQLAEIFNVSINTFFPNVENEFEITTIYNKLEPKRQKKVYSFASEQLKEQNKVVQINGYKNKKYIQETLRGYLSAGTGEMLVEDIEETINIPAEIVPEQHYDIVLKVNGDSMQPMFKDKEIVFIKKLDDYSQLRSGQIGAFIIDGESYLKKAYIEDDKLRLVSLNEKYEDLLFREFNDIKVIGTVVL